MSDRARLMLAGAVLVGGVLGALPSAVQAQGNIGAQGVTPQWTFRGRGLLSTPVIRSGGDEMDTRWQLIDFADTNLMTRLDTALYDDTIASFAVGARLTDADSPLWPVYLSQVEGALQTRYFVFQAGRRRRPSVGVTMPTLRDEDLLHFIFPLNPFSAGGLEEDAIFTDLVSGTLRWDMRWHAQLFLESLRNTTDTGNPADRAGIEPNSGALRLYYDQLPALRRVSILRHAGVGFYAQRNDDRIDGLGDRALMWQTKAEASVNVWPDPIHLVDARATLVYQHGVTDQPIDSITDSWRARYVSGALALRYLYAPYQLDRFQAGLSAGYRRLVDQPGWEAAIIPSLVYRPGGNLDIVLQYAFKRRSNELNAMIDSVPRREHRVELAFSYTFEVQLFGTVNLPRDLVNADYNYVPVN